VGKIGDLKTWNRLARNSREAFSVKSFK
jgi:hypothetical protein